LLVSGERGSLVQDVVVIEEHYADPEVEQAIGRNLPEGVAAKLMLSVDERIARLDRIGIATEVLSLNPPGLQGVQHSAPKLARAANDRLAEVVAVAGGRLGGFASLPTVAPQAAADELKRSVLDKGLCGAMIHGLTNGKFLDAAEFLPIFEAAEKLGVPIYLHPGEIDPTVKDVYFGGFTQTHPMFFRAAWGYTIETGTHAMRLVLSNLFDRYPELKIILGHFGEAIPFLLTRVDEALKRDTPMKNFREVFQRHFYVTSSGFFSDIALETCSRELGEDKVLFSLDAPYVDEEGGMAWLRNLQLTDEKMALFAAGTARQLLGLEGGVR
jgi:predicted TIM-barrel fold metal-dependent hydrolase